MTRYSERDDPRIQEVVATIVAETTRRFRVKSIIVAGGFGRGEASFIEADGRLKALSDCEVALVSTWSIRRRYLAELSRQLSHRLDLEIGMSNSILLRAYSVLPVPPVVSRLVWRPSIQHYDLREGGRVVFGKDILARLPAVPAEGIPFWEGLRLLFNRMASALRYFPGASANTDRDVAIYWTNKVVLACQDALLLSAGRYHHSYRARNLIFTELFPGSFGELSSGTDGFLSLAARATDYKLRPQREAYTEDLFDLWFDIAGICDRVLRYLVQTDMGFTFATWAEFQDRYLEHPNVRTKYSGLASSPLLQNALSGARMIATPSYRFPTRELVRHLRTPWRHIVYSLVPLVYFGVSREKRVDALLLGRARSTLSLFKQLKPHSQDPVLEWNYLRQETVDVWHRLCY